MNLWERNLTKPDGNTWVQEASHNSPVGGSFVCLCPTKGATWDLISSAATTHSAGILLQFLSLSQILARLLQTRAKREIQTCVTTGVFSLSGFMGCISLDRTSFPTLMGLGASIHQSLTFFQRQHSETKSAKMVSKCYKKEGGSCILASIKWVYFTQVSTRYFC